jgi:hypothetical protein
MAHRPRHCCDWSQRAWGDEPVRNTRAKVPEPNDDPKLDDEPDDEGDDEPEPGTLYFGEQDGWTAQSRCSPTSRPSRQAERAPWARRIRFLYDQVNAP